MLSENRASLVQYRFDQAQECLTAALVLINVEAYKDAANRLYYCIFHAMRAILAIEGFDSKKHSGIISAFRQRYIKTGVFPSELSDVIQDAFDLRSDSDYEDFYIISKDNILKQAENAKVFLSLLESYIKIQLSE